MTSLQPRFCDNNHGMNNAPYFIIYSVVTKINMAMSHMALEQIKMKQGFDWAHYNHNNNNKMYMLTSSSKIGCLKSDFKI